jgi:sugar/nucleoside kinase (ribokinase family)
MTQSSPNPTAGLYGVYAYGMISSSTLHILKQPFPVPDGYAELDRTYRMTGGEACNSAIVLSRLGVKVLLDGVWLGDTSDGRWLLETLSSFGIHTTPLRSEPGYDGVREIVISDEHSRTIFGNYIQLFSTTRQWNTPRKEHLASARLACIDPFFGAESQLAGQYAVELRIPYITIDCPADGNLAQNAAALIISGEFRDRTHPQADLLSLFEEFQTRVKGLLIFTCGSQEMLFSRKGQEIQHFPAYQVKAIDTAGAGDAFRSGVIYGMLHSWSDLETVRYASALAAIICTRFPGVLDCPTHEEVLGFIRSQNE